MDFAARLLAQGLAGRWPNPDEIARAVAVSTVAAAVPTVNTVIFLVSTLTSASAVFAGTRSVGSTQGIFHRCPG